nr:WD repeat-containing protein 55 [Ciona intestinalis]|eukprot:XP_002124173.1 WD repeat-containing protein 55 [Ciona intestinalis]
MSDSDSDFSDNSEANDDEKVSRPKQIRGVADFVDLSFHPSTTYTLATANMNGYVRLYNCVPGEECEQLAKVRVSKKPCRSLSFSYDGEDVLILTKDRTMHFVSSATGNLTRRIEETHRSAPYCLSVIDKNLLATGDDDGTLKVWDLRKGKDAVMTSEDKFEDYVSDIAVDDKRRLIFAVCGDGTMATFNARQRKFIVHSQNEESDLLCAKVIKNNNKVLVGSADGPILLYNWNEFAAPSDRFPGHPGPVDCIAKVSEDVVCTGSADGLIRAVHLLPNRFLGVVGDHHGLPVEKVEATHDGKFIASCSHDNLIKFWSVDHLKSVEVCPREKAIKQKRTEKMSKSGVGHGKMAFFSDLNNDIDTSTYINSSSSSDELDSDSDDAS